MATLSSETHCDLFVPGISPSNSIASAWINKIPPRETMAWTKTVQEKTTRMSMFKSDLSFRSTQPYSNHCRITLPLSESVRTAKERKSVGCSLEASGKIAQSLRLGAEAHQQKHNRTNLVRQKEISHILDAIEGNVRSVRFEIETSSQGHQDFTKQLNNKKQALQKSRRRLSELKAGLNSELGVVRTSTKKQSAKKKVIRRNSKAVVASLKQNLSDPPIDNKEELETECVWEVNVHLSLVKKTSSELLRNGSVLRSAREVLNGCYDDSRCRATTDRAGNLVSAMENMLRERLPSVDILKTLFRRGSQVRRLKMSLQDRNTKIRCALIKLAFIGLLDGKENTLRSLGRKLSRLTIKEAHLASGYYELRSKALSSGCGSAATLQHSRIPNPHPCDLSCPILSKDDIFEF